MTTLLILRHAKASHNLPVSDFDRPLTHAGERDADEVGRWLKERGLIPDLIVSSSAVRARTTAQRIAQACGYEGAVDLRPELYLAETQALVEALQDAIQRASTLLLVGHNPGLQSLVRHLTGRDTHLATAALARIELEGDLQARGKLRELREP